MKKPTTSRLASLVLAPTSLPGVSGGVADPELDTEARKKGKRNPSDQAGA